MPISNEEELRAATASAGALLQEIHDYCHMTDRRWSTCPEAKVRFPRGFIRTAGEQRARMPFLSDRVLKDNLAYTLMLSDVVLWVRMRTDLSGTAAEMLVKLYVFLMGALCESITKSYLSGICGRGYKARTEHLCAVGVITPALQADLDWLWDTRNAMHLFQLEEREYENAYDHECHMRAVRTFRGLLASLRAANPAWQTPGTPQ